MFVLSVRQSSESQCHKLDLRPGLRPPLQASVCEFPPESNSRDSVCGVGRCKQQTCIDHNTRHSHPWSDVVGGERGVSGMGVHWRTGGREGEESVDGVRWE